MVSDEQASLELLKPYLSRMRKAVEAGAGHVLKPEFGGLTSRIRALASSCSRIDSIAHQVQEEFRVDEPHVRFVEKNGRPIMLIGQDFAIRFKKLRTGSLKPQNQPTLANHDWCSQNPCFSGLDEPLHLDLGYTLTGPFRNILTVYLRCSEDEERYEWVWNLSSMADEPPMFGGVPLPTPTPGTPPIVRPKLIPTQTPDEKEEPGVASAT